MANLESLVSGLENQLVLDPITNDPMVDAVLVTESGRTYSEAVILRIIRETGKDPFTNIKITKEMLKPNYSVREAAREFVERNSGAQATLCTIDAIKSALLKDWSLTRSKERFIIDGIESIKPPVSVTRRYAAEVARLGKAGELKMQFHGTKKEHVAGLQSLGFRLPATFERQDSQNEGKLRFGKAIYTTASLRKACSYAENVIVICSLHPGRIWKRDETYEQLDPPIVHAKGFDSIVCDFMGKEQSERAIYSPDLVSPEFVIYYHTSQMVEIKDLPVKMPVDNIDVLLKFLHSTEKHQLQAFRYLGDCFRDNQVRVNRTIRANHDVFYSAVTEALKGENEQLTLMALRCLWNMSYEDLPVQGEIMTFLDPAIILHHMHSGIESVLLRAINVLVNLCHLETRNHAKIIEIDKNLGMVVVGAAVSALARSNNTLAEQALSCLANIASSGFTIVTQQVLDQVVEHFMFSPRPVHTRVLDAANRLCSNVIFKGNPDPKWVARGFVPSLGARGE